MTGFLDQIRDVLCEEFELEPGDIHPAALLYDDLDIDSIDAIDLLGRLRDITGKNVELELFKDVRTVADLISVLERT